MKGKKLKEKGITLIALVVTMIILLILAGVTIASVTGDNGLFRKAREATNMYKDSERDEQGVLGDAENELSKILNRWRLWRWSNTSNRICNRKYICNGNGWNILYSGWI